MGIDLNTGLAMEQIPGTNTIIYPQEIWEGFSHRRAVFSEQLPVNSNQLEVGPVSVIYVVAMGDSPEAISSRTGDCFVELRSPSNDT